MLKSQLRKKLIKIRKENNNLDIKIAFNQVLNLINKNNIKKIFIGGYFPVNYEIDDLDILKKFEKKGYKISMPVVKKNFDMNFYEWSFSDPLLINKYGIPEPKTNKLIFPDIILIPLLGFDKNLNRLGYGAGYYDRWIEKTRKKKNVLKIGLGLSSQKINDIPINKYDRKLDYVVTDKYII